MLIDTAEMYGKGQSEALIGEAFLVSKVYPHNASREAGVAACEHSLRRLDTDRIDLYLLHWRGNVPLAETIEASSQTGRQAPLIGHPARMINAEVESEVIVDLLLPSLNRAHCLGVPTLFK